MSGRLSRVCKKTLLFLVANIVFGVVTSVAVVIDVVVLSLSADNRCSGDKARPLRDRSVTAFYTLRKRASLGQAC
jgi:hypothetical protein